MAQGRSPGQLRGEDIGELVRRDEPNRRPRDNEVYRQEERPRGLEPALAVGPQRDEVAQEVRQGVGGVGHQGRGVARHANDSLADRKDQVHGHCEQCHGLGGAGRPLGGGIVVMLVAAMAVAQVHRESRRGPSQSTSKDRRSVGEKRPRRRRRRADRGLETGAKHAGGRQRQAAKAGSGHGGSVRVQRGPHEGSGGWRWQSGGWRERIVWALPILKSWGIAPSIWFASSKIRIVAAFQVLGQRTYYSYGGAPS